MHLAPEFLNVTKLQIVELFVIYSILGWMVESAYMSLCTRKLTNRGFGFGPFCPIYGFGASIGAVLLSAFRDNAFVLFVVAAIGATCFEFIVGKLMQFFLGDFWWDYTDKPFNFQGIICLESTLGWGMYGIGVVYYLHPYVLSKIRLIPGNLGLFLCCLILGAYMVDFFYHVLLALHIDIQESVAKKQRYAMDLAREKKNDAMVLVREKKNDAMMRVQERRQAVLRWYRSHRWR